MLFHILRHTVQRTGIDYLTSNQHLPKTKPTWLYVLNHSGKHKFSVDIHIRTSFRFILRAILFLLLSTLNLRSNHLSFCIVIIIDHTFQVSLYKTNWPCSRLFVLPKEFMMTVIFTPPTLAVLLEMLPMTNTLPTFDELRFDFYNLCYF